MPHHFRRVADDNDTPVDRGTYRRVREYWNEWFGPRGKPNPYWAELCCPGCGKVGMLGDNHTVAASGIVTPSDVCPYPPCTYHEFVVLDDWDRPSTPRRLKDDTRHR
jgi:hypothetical protein